MKKALITILAVFLLGVGVFFGYEYATEPKIVDGVMSKKIDDKGRPIGLTSTFEPGDTVYFSAKRNRFWIDKAQIVWYKGEIAPENRFLVEEEVIVNKAKYFSTELSVPEGLEEGHYGVTIYVKGSDIMETKAEFDVKK
ncbi:hypothetical protein [Mesobacillus maritimus]|jgi:signal peptidase I|uniref:Intracellular proteinase inhibitor BsuPI domain-containing protein n=1 Tax=Mesobacillus maritimus TaxID=1643336 RepID=A0ABS7K6D7_9BACI|nr:hypothetical protein [Mesobacillus maritimus]MBY0097826.1 hypothetical protein [Mesobacillus maritimus]